MTSPKTHPFSFSGSALIGIVLLLGLGVFGVLLKEGLTGAISAQSPALDLSTPDGMFALLKDGSQAVNQYHDKIPQSFITLFGNERIQGEIALSSGKTLVIGAVTKDGKLVSFTKGPLEKPTLKAFTDESTIKTIMASPSKVDAVQSALDAKTIRYQAQTVTGKVKYGLAGWLLSWFSPRSTS